MTEIETRVYGIPCIVLVTWYEVPEYTRCWPPRPEIEFKILDRRGRQAKWLERKLSDSDRLRLEDEIIEYMDWVESENAKDQYV